MFLSIVQVAVVSPIYNSDRSSFPIAQAVPYLCVSRNSVLGEVPNLPFRWIWPADNPVQIFFNKHLSLVIDILAVFSFSYFSWSMKTPYSERFHLLSFQLPPFNVKGT